MKDKNNIKSTQLLRKFVSKTTKGGRRRSISSMYLSYRNIGEISIRSCKSKDNIGITNHINNVKPHVLTQYKVSKFKTLFSDYYFKFKGMFVIAKRMKSGTGIKCSTIIRPILEKLGLDNCNIKFKGQKNPLNKIAAIKKLIKMNEDYYYKNLVIFKRN